MDAAEKAQADEHSGRFVARRKGQNERLERIGGLLNWGRIDQLLNPIYAAGEERPAYRPLVMVRALLLQQWYSLSDPERERRLAIG